MFGFSCKSEFSHSYVYSRKKILKHCHALSRYPTVTWFSSTSKKPFWKTGLGWCNSSSNSSSLGMLLSTKMRKNEMGKILSNTGLDPTQKKLPATIVLAWNNYSSRWYFDYNFKPNAVRNRDISLIPRTKKFINYFGKAAAFPALEDSTVFWKVDKKPEDRDNTASTAHHGLNRFTSMQF